VVPVPSALCVSCGAVMGGPAAIDPGHCADCGDATNTYGVIAAATADEVRRSRLHLEFLALCQQIADLESEAGCLQSMGRDRPADSDQAAVERQWVVVSARLATVERGLGLRFTYERVTPAVARSPGQRVSDVIAVAGALGVVIGLIATQVALAGLGLLMVIGGIITGIS
jgi:hypothetical protein